MRWYLWLPVLAEMINFFPSIGAFFSSNISIVLFCYFLTALLTAVYLGPSIAVTHNLIDARKRALASAILFFVLNLIGLGFGPIIIGYISDVLTPQYGAESLRYAFCFSFFTGTVAMILFYLASRSYPKDLEESLV
jgi:MFS family permease